MSSSRMSGPQRRRGPPTLYLPLGWGHGPAPAPSFERPQRARGAETTSGSGFVRKGKQLSGWATVEEIDGAWPGCLAGAGLDFRGSN